MKLIKVKEASKLSGFTELYIRALIKQGVPWGDAVKYNGSSRYTYKIYKPLFDGWLKERS